MRIIVFMMAGLAILGLCGTPVGAEPVPDRATGIWSVGDCGGDGLTVLVNSRAALMIEGEGEDARVAIAEAEWAGSSFVLTAQGDEHELMLPPVDSLEQCDALPSSFALPFAEAVAVFREFDEIDENCTDEDGVSTLCIAVVFDIIDITGDGEFSRAELSRGIRAASFFVGHRLITDERRDPFVPLGELYLIQLVAAAFGPLVAANLIDSYDFDGDGFLSLKELLQDRSPEQGLEGFAAGLATELPSALVPTLLKSVTGIFELLP